MCLYEATLFMSLLGFMWYYVVVKHAPEECQFKMSAIRMIFVKIIFAVCVLLGIVV